jgi:hypothetical protein
MPRADITMSADQVAAFLERCSWMVVGAAGSDGFPTVAVVTAARIDGEMVLDLPAGEVLEAVDAGQVVCAMADESASYYEIQGVMLYGPARLRPDGRHAIDTRRTVSFDFGRLRR